MTLSIREIFALEDWDNLRSFFESHYWPDVAVASKAYFLWQFGTDANAASLITGRDEDRIVGTLGCAVSPAFWGDTRTPIEGAWLLAWMVHPHYRYGVGVALLRTAGRRFPIILGIGATPENERIFAGLGWNVFPSVPRYISVFDPKRAAEFALTGVTGAQLRAAHRPPSASALSDRSDKWNAAAYAPSWEKYEPMRFATIRTSQFLRWRYLEHPVYHFVILTAGDPERPAVCVYRIEQARDIDGRVGRILEFFHPSDPAGKAAGISLLRGVSLRLEAEGCCYADIVVSSSEFGDTLVEAGWLREPPGFQLLAVRLQPVERVAYFRFNVEYAVHGGLQRPVPERMYVTRGDGDADRPTVIPAPSDDSFQPFGS